MEVKENLCHTDVVTVATIGTCSTTNVGCTNG